MIKKILYPIKVLYLFLDFIYNLVLSLYCYKTFKIYFCNHLTLGIWCLYKSKTLFPHPIGIVIGEKVKIGKNCIIYQNVTIGAKDTINYKIADYPVIGDNVTIYPNSIIIGKVKLGNNSVIGAGAIVLKDVEDNSIVVGNPAKVI